MVRKKTTTRKAKQPSRLLVSMINGYNKENEAKNRALIKKRKAIIARAKKEGFTVNVK